MGVRHRSLKLRYEKNDSPKASVIGMIGLGSGVGTTHFAILLANYLIGVRRKKTAVLEWNRDHGFEKMRVVCNAKRKGDFFTVLEADYFPAAGEDQLIGCMSGNYHYVIIDFGDNYDTVRTEYLRCEYKFVTASLSEWQISAFLEFVRGRSKGEKKELEYFVCFGSEETRIEAERRLHLSLRRIPVSVDAFTVTKEIMAFFDAIL